MDPPATTITLADTPTAQSAHAALAEQQRALSARLGSFRTAQDRLAWLIEQARSRPLMPVEHRTDENRVPGCLARLWLVSDFREGRCYFTAESDSLIVKAVAGLLCEFYSDRTPAEILGHSPEFLGKLGIQQHLTPNRRNALSRVWQHIRAVAEAHASPKSI